MRIDLMDLIDLLVDIRNQHGDCPVYLTVGEVSAALERVLGVDTRTAGGKGVVVELSTEDT